MERERRGRDYWEEQLSEYWDSGLTIQEYSELKELPYKNTRRWIAALKRDRESKSNTSGDLGLVEVSLPAESPKVSQQSPPWDRCEEQNLGW